MTNLFCTSTRRTAQPVKWACSQPMKLMNRQMIQKNIRVNNEFYVAPVYNQAILDNKKFIIYNIKKMWPVGTPEDLKNYIESN